jgi:nuclear pore complex protein Nup188
LQVLASATTLALLKLPDSLALVMKNSRLSQADALSRSKPYFLSRQHITEINEIFLNTVNAGILSASPAAFAWGAVLLMMRDIALAAKDTREMELLQTAVDSFQSNTPAASPIRTSEQTFYEELIDVVRVPAYGDNFVEILTIGSAENGQLFNVITNIASTVGTLSAIDDAVTAFWIRGSLLGIVRVSAQIMDYSPEILTATLSILEGSPDDFRGHDDSGSVPSDPRYVFLNDDKLMERIFHVSRSRFPYESIPFLRLCRALIGKDGIDSHGAAFVLNQLESMETFTQVVPSDFQGYETIREDENANFVSLVQPISMLASQPRKSKGNTLAETTLVVTGSSQLKPATTGQVVSESKPAVVMWYHGYSCISFLGSWLEAWSTNGGDVPGTDEETIAEIISLLTDLLAAFRGADSQEDDSGPRKILEIASEGLSNCSDIVSVIYDILERNLQDSGGPSGIRGSVELVVACVRFVRVLVPILPNRIWPFLSRTSMLDTNGQGGRWSAIVSAAEVTSGDYPFLLSFVELFEAVIEDAISNSAVRKVTSREVSRAGDVPERSAGVPSHIISKVLSSFVRSMVGVYNSTGNWRFKQVERKLQIETLLAKNLEKVIYYTYGIDGTENGQSKISGVFYESATYILDVLRPQSNDELPFNPVLRIIIDGLQTPPTTIYLRQSRLIEGQLIATLNLAIKLTQTAHLLQSPSSLLEDQLFKASSVLVKLYSSHHRYRLPVTILLELLISKAAADSENEPPSLVGHLGSESTCLFLDVLAQFDNPLSDKTLFVSIWRLLSAFVSKRQQWLAIYLLTGSSPRDSLKLSTSSEKAPRMRSTPFLKTALDTLANIDQIDPSVSLALLEFISCSQEHWPWATVQLGNHTNFFSSVINHVAHLKLENQPITSQISLTQIAAITANLCAIYLHSAKEARDQTFTKMLIPLVFWYAENAVDVSSYNASLHANLKKNFEMKYSGCRLPQFKRTSLESRPLGRDYYYDLSLSDKVLSFGFSWRGKKGQGFADEFERANLNLSLVEAQVVSDDHIWKSDVKY